MDKYEERSRVSYNEKALNYDNSPEGEFTDKYNKILLNKVSIKENDKILDIACGNGKLLKKMFQLKPFDGYGADISENMIMQAKKNNPQMNFSVSACDKLPYADSFFNTIIVCAAYHHFPHVQDFAKEVSRIIKPNGLVYIAEIYMTTFFRTVLNPFVKLSKAGDVRFYSPQEIVSLFERNGFSKQSIDIIDGSIQIVTLRKGE